ncbi:MAG: response regulator transcription factor [Bacteroidia bacterium]|nr:response regulator transcription factor [Bacteroidia bacterium]
MKVLVIEDEPKVASFLQKGLKEQGYEVDIAYDGLLGEKMVSRNQYDIILLDIIIPYINGIELCKKIRQANSNVPVLMLTALGTTDDKLMGFDEGADDYIVKPFEFKELLARIRALIKRASGHSEISSSIKVADLELDLHRKIARRGDVPIELTAKEFALLEFFMRNKNKVLSRAEIAEKVWDITLDTGTNVVDVYVNILRKKIDKNFDNKLLQTRIGMGYIFQDE